MIFTYRPENVVRTDTDFVTYDYTPITRIDENKIVKTVVDTDEDDEHGDNVTW